jgi:hypothetical protein
MVDVMVRTYSGARTFDGVVVTVDGRPLDARRDLHTYSLNNYEWGYEGDETRQLAQAIIADAVDDDAARAQCEAFMRAIVANFDNEWEITDEQVRAALRDLSPG